MRNCPTCATPMVQWGYGRMERWRCPACFRKRRKSYHRKVEITGAPLVQVEGVTTVVSDPDVTLYNGSAIEALASLPDESVQMIATSPPFWNLRDYEVEGQIGHEETPEEWAASLVEVFREARRVLSDNGTLWIEVGDSWMNKELVGQPWLLAFALKDDGWVLRQEIIWEKPNAMTESIRDRPTRSHSNVFLFSKQHDYYYDIDAIRTPHQHDGRRVTTVKQGENSIQHRDGERWPGEGANARSVWSIATSNHEFKHHATWPEKLVSRMILAGCPEDGVVLDPFAGSGTTLRVARALGRKSIGIELNPEYCKLAAERTQQLSLLA